MKVVGFEFNNHLRLGMVEGDNVVDLQEADPKSPTELCEVLRQTNGDLSSLADLAKRAPASAHRPLSAVKYALPVMTPGKITASASTTSTTSRKDRCATTSRNSLRSSFAC